LNLENKNNFDLGLNVLEYEVWLAEVSIVNAKLSKFAKVDKNRISYIQLPFTEEDLHLKDVYYSKLQDFMRECMIWEQSVYKSMQRNFKSCE
jgi:hypothetical protein